MNDRIPVIVDPDLEDLIPGFLDNRHADVAKLTSLVAQNAYAEIRLIGHSMKGVGGGYGFDPITDIGGAIERAALAEDGDTIRQCTQQLADYLARIEVVFGE